MVFPRSWRSGRWWLLAGVTLVEVGVLLFFLNSEGPGSNKRSAAPTTTPSPTQDSAGPSGPAATSEDQALTGNPCRFTVETEVEAIVQAKLELSGTETTCSFDPLDTSSRGVKYSLDRYKEEVYVSLTGDAEPVQGLGEKAAVSNLNPGAHLIIKKGNLLVLVTTGGSGFSDFGFAQQSAISIAEKILTKL